MGSLSEAMQMLIFDDSSLDVDTRVETIDNAEALSMRQYEAVLRNLTHAGLFGCALELLEFIAVVINIQLKFVSHETWQIIHDLCRPHSTNEQEEDLLLTAQRYLTPSAVAQYSSDPSSAEVMATQPAEFSPLCLLCATELTHGDIAINDNYCGTCAFMHVPLDAHREPVDASTKQPVEQSSNCQPPWTHKGGISRDADLIEAIFHGRVTPSQVDFFPVVLVEQVTYSMASVRLRGQKYPTRINTVDFPQKRCHVLLLDWKFAPAKKKCEIFPHTVGTLIVTRWAFTVEQANEVLHDKCFGTLILT